MSSEESQNVRVTKRTHYITLTTGTFLRFVICSLRFVMLTFWNYYVLKLLRLETITFSDASLSDTNFVLCYVLLQYLDDIWWVPAGDGNMDDILC